MRQIALSLRHWEPILPPEVAKLRKIFAVSWAKLPRCLSLESKNSKCLSKK